MILKRKTGQRSKSNKRSKGLSKLRTHCAPRHAPWQPTIPMEQRLVDKKDLTEQEIRTRYITPAIRDDAGWPLHQIREELYLMDEQILPR